MTPIAPPSHTSEKTRKKKDDGESPEERKSRLAQERKERLERQKQIEVGKGGPTGCVIWINR